jgi:hypothetical protein
VRIFYVTQGVHRSGGQRVNLDHVASLRRLGYDARFLFVRADGTPPEPFPDGYDLPWQATVDGLTRDDIVVVGEMFGAGALAVMETLARKVLHNQGPFYTFMAFSDLDALRRWGAEAMILPSHFAAGMVRRMGWARPAHVVRPALDPVFAAAAGAPRALRIAAIPNRRPQEWRLIRGALRSQRPDLAAVPWVEIKGLPREGVARELAGSEIFLATGLLEGLGLPPLEAMATGALVVGFHGGGGTEYATSENGDWFDDGAHLDVAETLARRIDELRAGETFHARRLAGRATAAHFNAAAFEAQLAEAWRAIAGPP